MTKDSDGVIPIVERLRRWEGDGHPHGLLHREAADTITELVRSADKLVAASVVYPGEDGRAHIRRAEWDEFVSLITELKARGNTGDRG